MIAIGSDPARIDARPAALPSHVPSAARTLRAPLGRSSPGRSWVCTVNNPSKLYKFGSCLTTHCPLPIQRDTWRSRTLLRDDGALNGAWPSPRHVCRCRPGPTGSPLEGESCRHIIHQHTRLQSAPAEVSLRVMKAKACGVWQSRREPGEGTVAGPRATL